MSSSPPSAVLLGVNIDHVATVRQARYRAHRRSAGGPVEPDPVAFAQAAERAGADGITVHLREDRRHIQPDDVHRLRAVLQIRLNFEMAATDEMRRFALELAPDSVCLVPEHRAEVTTEGGLDVAGQASRLADLTQAFRSAGIDVSHFIDPEPAQVEAARAAGANWVELHTGAYAEAYGEPGARTRQWERLVAAARQAHAAGLVVNAGHGINYTNVRQVRTLPHLHECNIGHAIVARALFEGVGPAVAEMRRRLNAP